MLQALLTEQINYAGFVEALIKYSQCVLLAEQRDWQMKSASVRLKCALLFHISTLIRCHQRPIKSPLSLLFVEEPWLLGKSRKTVWFVSRVCSESRPAGLWYWLCMDRSQLFSHKSRRDVVILKSYSKLGKNDFLWLNEEMLIQALDQRIKDSSRGKKIKILCSFKQKNMPLLK